MFGAASSVQFCAFEPLLCKQYSSLPDPAVIIVIIINSIIVVTIIVMTFVRDLVYHQHHHLSLHCHV